MANKQLRSRIVEVTENLEQCDNDGLQDAQIQHFQDIVDVVGTSMLAEREPSVESHKTVGKIDLRPETSTVCLGNKDTEGLDALKKFMENVAYSIIYIVTCVIFPWLNNVSTATTMG
jgi:hypothetical protein